MNEDILIRTARPEDAAALLGIYRWYVENTALSYEYAAPSEDEFRGRIINIMKQYPYLVAEQAGEILGYAYASKYREREAYAWNAETSVYLHPDARGKGTGKMLYTRLEELLRAQGVVKLMASITMPKDGYSDFGSLRFHERMGFKLAGRFENCGYKFGCWYTTAIMDKFISEARDNMAPIKTFEEIRDRYGV